MALSPSKDSTFNTFALEERYRGAFELALLAESLRSFLDTSGKRKRSFLFPSYLRRSKPRRLCSQGRSSWDRCGKTSLSPHHLIFRLAIFTSYLYREVEEIYRKAWCLWIRGGLNSQLVARRIWILMYNTTIINSVSYGKTSNKNVQLAGLHHCCKTSLKARKSDAAGFTTTYTNQHVFQQISLNFRRLLRVVFTPSVRTTDQFAKLTFTQPATNLISAADPGIFQKGVCKCNWAKSKLPASKEWLNLNHDNM